MRILSVAIVSKLCLPRAADTRRLIFFLRLPCCSSLDIYWKKTVMSDLDYIYNPKYMFWYSWLFSLTVYKYLGLKAALFLMKKTAVYDIKNWLMLDKFQIGYMHSLLFQYVKHSNKEHNRNHMMQVINQHTESGHNICNKFFVRILNQRYI